MNKLLLCFLVACFCLSGSNASASNSYAKHLVCLQQEIENLMGKGDDDKSLRQAVIKANVSRLECVVEKKINKLQSRLITYKANLNNCESGDEAQHWVKKLSTVERKLKDLNEVLFGIEILKMKLAS